ncbi:MAG: aminotransferase class I/II-fold pyridoxal phosphate-dependent enzyme [Micrococcales bacterium]|nr:aminotransferase class I/II-fold pyridoxal phosphate-dependent enzyme [Micrococcales bacterium]
MPETVTLTSPLQSAERQAEIRSQVAGLVSEYFDLMPQMPADECPLSVPLYGADEVNGALDSLLTQNITMGAKVRQFEKAFAEHVGSRHAVMVNSGSSANLLALAVLSDPSVPGGLRPGDEVIVPAVTWSTTLAPILQHGCVPVLVDIDPKTLNLRPEDLEAALSPKTRAIMPVHLLGNPVAMGPLMELAERHDLWVVEDTCESLGSTFEGRAVGTFGDMGTYSFFFSHHITTIEGGMLVTDDDRLADLARSIRAHGWTRDMAQRDKLEAANPSIDPRFLFVHVGYNLRPMEISAAFGLVQLQRLEEFNEQRRANVAYLAAALDDLRDEIALVTEQPGGRSTWFGFTAITKDSSTRLALSEHLESRGIATRPIVAGNLAVQPAFRDNPHRLVGDLANATAVGERGLFVGNHPNLTPAHLDHIVAGFRSFFDRA